VRADKEFIQLRSLSKPADYLISSSTVLQVSLAVLPPFIALNSPSGTGKTSTVLALARRLYGPPYRKHILELNASDDRGIDVVREQIKSFAMTKVLFS